MFKGPSRLSEPGPRLQQMMDSGKSSSLNASIRERLRSKVRGKQVFLKHHMQYHLYGHGKGESLSTAYSVVQFPTSAKLHLKDAWAMKVLSTTSILKSPNNPVNMYEGSPNLYQFELMHMSCLVFIYNLIK